MGALKNYIMELADKKGVEFDEITNEDIEMDINKGDNFDHDALLKFITEGFKNNTLNPDDIEKYKKFLPTKSYSEISYYDAETGTPKFKVGDVMVDGSFTFYLIVD